MKALIFLADGFEEIEALTAADYLRRLDIDAKLVSIYDRTEVEGASGIKVLADTVLKDADTDSADALIIPGGLPGATNLRDDERVIDAVKSAYEKGKITAAICAGPSVLQKAGIMEGKKATCYPGFEEEVGDAVHTGKNVEKDGNIITGKGPYLAGDFAIEIARALLGDEKAEELSEQVLKK